MKVKSEKKKKETRGTGGILKSLVRSRYEQPL